MRKVALNLIMQAFHFQYDQSWLYFDNGSTTPPF